MIELVETFHLFKDAFIIQRCLHQKQNKDIAHKSILVRRCDGDSDVGDRISILVTLKDIECWLLKLPKRSLTF